MKKLVVLILFSLFCLTGCDEAIITETEEAVENFKEQYFVEMPPPNPEISFYSVDLEFRAGCIDELELYQNLDKIQNWLDSCNNTEIIEMISIEDVNNAGIIGIEFMMQKTSQKHDYRIIITESTPNIQGYVSSIKIRDVGEHKGYNIVLIDYRTVKDLENKVGIENPEI